VQENSLSRHGGLISKSHAAIANAGFLRRPVMSGQRYLEFSEITRKNSKKFTEALEAFLIAHALTSHGRNREGTYKKALPGKYRAGVSNA